MEPTVPLTPPSGEPSLKYRGFMWGSRHIAVAFGCGLGFAPLKFSRSECG